MPAAVTEIASHRLLFLLLDTVTTVREAQAGRLGFRNRRTTYRSVAGQGGAVPGDVELLRGARLGPAWAPAVHRLLDRAGHAARPGTAAALHDLLGPATHATAPGSAGGTAP